MKLIAQGAEAKVYENGDMIVKYRIPKPYRIKEIDEKIIKSRIKKEAKILNKLQTVDFNSPKLIKIESNSIYMEKIEGKVLKDCLNEENYLKIMYQVGNMVSKLHLLDIIHGDLTTLNFMMNNDGNIFMIDFGLASFSHSEEDKAVDLYVFERALICAHGNSYLTSFYDGYNGDDKVMTRLNAVRKRGRKRQEEAFG